MATTKLNKVAFELYKGGRDGNGAHVPTTIDAKDAIILAVNTDRPAPRQALGRDGGFDGIRHGLRAIEDVLRFGRFDVALSEPGLYLFNSASYAFEDTVDRVGTIAATYDGEHKVFGWNAMSGYLFAPVSAFDGALQVRQWDNQEHANNAQEYYRLVHQVMFGQCATHIWIAQMREQPDFFETLAMWTTDDDAAAWKWRQDRRTGIRNWTYYGQNLGKSTRPVAAASLPQDSEPEGDTPSNGQPIVFPRIVGSRVDGVIDLTTLPEGTKVMLFNARNGGSMDPNAQVVNLRVNRSYWANLQAKTKAPIAIRVLES